MTLPIRSTSSTRREMSPEMTTRRNNHFLWKTCFVLVMTYQLYCGIQASRQTLLTIPSYESTPTISSPSMLLRNPATTNTTIDNSYPSMSSFLAPSQPPILSSSPTASPPIVSSPASPSYPTLNRVLIAIVAYDTSQVQYLERLLDSISDLCAVSTDMQVDIALYTSVVWPQSFIEEWEESNLMKCGRMEIILKSPIWGHLIVNFHRQLFYDRIEEYDLFVYTEDDLLLQPRHILGYWRETQRLQQVLGGDEEAAAAYSIGFLRYEWRHGDPTVAAARRQEDGASESTSTNATAEPIWSSNDRMVWEHRWNLTSVEAFRERHVVSIPNSDRNGVLQHPPTYEHYFNGAGNFHQGMYMATSSQLKAWATRPPRCNFRDSPWRLPIHLHREKVSSLQLFWKGNRGCNVTQLIPMEKHQDFLIYHMSNKQWFALWRSMFKNSPRNFRSNPMFPVELKQLSNMISDFRKQHSNNASALPQEAIKQGQKKQLRQPGTREQSIFMYNGEIDEPNDQRRVDGFDPDLSAYQAYYGLSAVGQTENSLSRYLLPPETGLPSTKTILCANFTHATSSSIPCNESTDPQEQNLTSTRVIVLDNPFPDEGWNISDFLTEEEMMRSFRFEMPPAHDSEVHRYVSDTDLTRCEFMEDWQRQSVANPTCNLLHEVGFRAGSEPTPYSSLITPMNEGSRKQVWKVHENGETHNNVLLKTNKYVERYEGGNDRYADAKDGLIMEQTTGSPHIISSHGWCHQSSLVEKADGRLDDWAEKNIFEKVKKNGGEMTPEISDKIVRVAVELTKGLYDMQLIQNSDKLPKVVHGDLKQGQFLVKNGKDKGFGLGVMIKLDDFNYAHLLTANATKSPLGESKTVCPYPETKTHRTFSRAAEEYSRGSPLTHKIDVSALGSIFFWLLTDSDAYSFDYSNSTDTSSPYITGRSIAREEFKKNIRRDVPPSFPPCIAASKDKKIQALVKTIKICKLHDPTQRPMPEEIIALLTNCIKEGIQDSDTAQTFRHTE